MAAPKVTQATLKTPEQTQLMKLITDALTSGSGPLADIFGQFNEGEFQKGVVQPGLKNFTENILPQLQEQYVSRNQVGGSGQARAQLKAGTDLQSQFDALRYGAQNQQKQNRISGAQNAISQNTFDNIVEEKQPKSSIWESILPGLVTTAAGFAGGPGGAALVNGLFGVGKATAGAKQPNATAVG